MATQGSYNGHERREAGEKGTAGGRNFREYRSRENQNSTDYKKRENRNFKSGEGRSRDGQASGGEYKSRENRPGGYKPRDNRPGGYKPRDNRPGEYKPRDNRNSYGGGYNNFSKDKDEDDGKKNFRSARPKTSEKPKEPQPDKFETIKRLEREQKTIKKKNPSGIRQKALVRSKSRNDRIIVIY